MWHTTRGPGKFSWSGLKAKWRVHPQTQSYFHCLCSHRSSSAQLSVTVTAWNVKSGQLQDHSFKISCFFQGVFWRLPTKSSRLEADHPLLPSTMISMSWLFKDEIQQLEDTLPIRRQRLLDIWFSSRRVWEPGTSHSQWELYLPLLLSSAVICSISMNPVSLSIYLIIIYNSTVISGSLLQRCGFTLSSACCCLLLLREETMEGEIRPLASRKCLVLAQNSVI